jgi:hypothetical protein
MSTQAHKFTKAAEEVKKLQADPDNDEKLKVSGNPSGLRPQCRVMGGTSHLDLCKSDKHAQVSSVEKGQRTMRPSLRGLASC